jgi:hypothetical protein
MISMRYLSWLRSLTSRVAGPHSHRKLRQKRPTSLVLEILEDRQTPSAITVTDANDTAGSATDVTLRYAVNEANTDAVNNISDTITFDTAQMGTNTITLTQGDLHLTAGTGTTTIDGGGQITINGNDTFRVDSGAQGIVAGLTFNATAGSPYNAGTLTVSDCTISDNSYNGIYNNGGAMTVSNCTISGNSGPGIDNNAGVMALTNCTISGNSGSGIYAGGTVTASNCTISGNSLSDNATYGGGGIYGSGTFTNCTISDNSASGSGSYGNGGGIFGGGTYIDCTISGNSCDGNIGGGGIAAYGALGPTTLTNCAVSGNTAYNGSGGGINDLGTVIVSNCTISGNSTTGEFGGGIQDSGGSLTVTNSTISGNSGGFGGGIALGAAYNNTAAVSNCTISGNSAAQSAAGGGIFLQQGYFGILALQSSIVAGNAAGAAPDVYGVITDNGFNLLGTGVNDPSPGPGDIFTDSPDLAPLGNYGGPTQTMALLPGSPAIGAGSNPLDLGTDQRGEPRSVNGTVDIGAFESQGFTLNVVGGNNQATLTGTEFNPLVVSVTANNPVEPVDGDLITFTVNPAIDGAAATLSSATATIADGQASVNATANSVIGSYTVNASATTTATDAGGTYDGSAFPASGAVTGAGGLSTTPTSFSYVGTGSTVYAATSVAPTNVGSYTVTASDAGDAYHTGSSSAAVPFIISQATSTITVSDAGGIYTGSPFAASGTVTGAGGLNTTPTSFSYVGTDSTIYPATSVAPTNVGTYTVTASYAGDANHAGSMSVAVPFTITAVAVSITGDVYVLNQSASGALTISGNAVLNVQGTLQVDSSSASAVMLSGNADVNAAHTLIVGGDQVSGNAHFNHAPTTHAAYVANPLALLAAPTGGTSYAAVNLAGNNTLTINPGVYPAITVSGNAHLILNPGIYVIGSGGVTISGNAAVTSGQGVLVYNNGALSVSGNASVNLTAYSTGDYAGLAIFQAQTDASAVTVSGNANLNLNGSFLYDANVQSVVTIGGNGDVEASLVVNELTISGNSDDSSQ